MDGEGKVIKEAHGLSATAFAQGAHSLAVGDVDGDGCDEITYGSAAINHDGSLLYSTGLGHGDASISQISTRTDLVWKSLWYTKRSLMVLISGMPVQARFSTARLTETIPEGVWLRILTGTIGALKCGAWTVRK